MSKNVFYYFRPRMISMLLLGFASGFPFSLSGSTLQAWFTDAGVNIETIGALSLVGLPYLLTPIWAPLMDRFVPPFLGRRRGWMIIWQLLLVVAIFSMAFLSPTSTPITLAIVALAVAFFSASQDISLDAYRTDLLDAQERGLGAAVWTSGWRLAVFVSGGVALILAGYFGWRFCFIVMAACMLVGVITTLFSQEPKQARIPASLREAVVEPFLEFFQRPVAWLLLLFILLYKFGDAFAVSLSTTFYLRGIGLSLQQVGALTKTLTMVATIFGVFVGGVLMIRWKLYRSLLIFGILQALSTLMFLWLALVGKNLTLVSWTIFIEHATSGMGTAVFVAYLMSLCDKRFTAFQYALFSLFASIPRVLIGPIAGFVMVRTGWPVFFVWGFLFAIPGLLLLVYLRNKVSFDADTVR